MAVLRAPGHSQVRGTRLEYCIAGRPAGAPTLKTNKVLELLILPADLPHLMTEDIQALTKLVGDSPHAIVIAPDATETGTNALLIRPPDLIQPSFGPDSFNRHCALARSAGVEPTIYRSPSLACDIDLPADLNHLPATVIS